MKRLRLALLATLLIPTLMVGCGGSGDTTPPASAGDAVVEDAAEAPDTEVGDETPAAEEPTEGGGKLVMATEPGFRPYEYYEGTDVVGVDVDIAREIAAELGMELVIESMEFSAITAAVDSGKADFGAAGMSITEERMKQVDFSIEYAISRQVIMTTADSAIMTPADLDGHDVGVQLGTVADYELTDEYPEVNVVPYNKYMDATNDLLIGRIQAIVLDVLPAQELLTMDDSLVIRDEELLTDKYAFCVKKGNADMLEAINTVMQRLLDEGKIDEFTATHSA